MSCTKGLILSYIRGWVSFDGTTPSIRMMRSLKHLIILLQGVVPLATYASLILTDAFRSDKIPF